MGYLSLAVFYMIIMYSDALPCRDDTYERNGRCCQKCPKGTYIKTHCSGGRPDTECAPCQKGTFSSDWNHLTTCTPCTRLRCSSTGMKLIQNCTATTNYKCGCILANQYYHKVLDHCMVCTGCGPGQHRDRPCSKETVCKQCPENYFSNRTENYSTECNKCTVCQIYKRQCNTTHDAVCDDRIVDVSTTISTSTMKTLPSVAPTGQQINKDEKQTAGTVDVTFVVVIGIVIAVVLCILIVLLILKRKKGLCWRVGRFSIIEESRYERLNTGILFRELPPTVIFGLHKQLNPDGSPNWRELGSELGFSYAEIINFAVDRAKSAENMLASWGTKGSSTVDRLHEALNKIGRQDAANFLADNIPNRNTEEKNV